MKPVALVAAGWWTHYITGDKKPPVWPIYRLSEALLASSITSFISTAESDEWWLSSLGQMTLENRQHTYFISSTAKLKKKKKESIQRPRWRNGAFGALRTGVYAQPEKTFFRLIVQVVGAQSYQCALNRWWSFSEPYYGKGSDWYRLRPLRR